jgi:hypothetical protein
VICYSKTKRRNIRQDAFVFYTHSPPGSALLGALGIYIGFFIRKLSFFEKWLKWRYVALT